MPKQQPKPEQQPETELRIPVECWTRVVGYMRPVDSFNRGKQQEVAERVVFKVPDADPAA